MSGFQPHSEVVVNDRKREIICGDAISWLNSFPDNGLPAKYSGFTSMPDISELPEVFGNRTENYKSWFTESAALFMKKLAPNNYIVFLQSDVRVMNSRRQVTEWIDKSYLISKAAEQTGCRMMWHKLVLINQENKKRSTGRPTYSHLVCYVKDRKTETQDVSKGAADGSADDELAPSSTPSSSSASQRPVYGEDLASYRTSLFAIPDIFYRGHMLWPKGIGLDCCYVAIQFLKTLADADGVIDPFAGMGTTLAMANACGIDALGNELSNKRCRQAKNLVIDLELISPYLRNIALDIVALREEEAMVQRTFRLDEKGQEEKKAEKERARLEKLRLKNSSPEDSSYSLATSSEVGEKEREEK